MTTNEWKERKIKLMTAFYYYMSSFRDSYDFYHASCLEDDEINPNALSPKQISHQFVKLMPWETTEKMKCAHCKGPLGTKGFKESLESTKQHRNMPWLEYGMVVEMDGKRGFIRGGNASANLDVEFPGQDWLSNVHPWWETVYYKDGEVIADYRKQ